MTDGHKGRKTDIHKVYRETDGRKDNTLKHTHTHTEKVREIESE